MTPSLRGCRRNLTRKHSDRKLPLWRKNKSFILEMACRTRWRNWFEQMTRYFHTKKRAIALYCCCTFSQMLPMDWYLLLHHKGMKEYFFLIEVGGNTIYLFKFTPLWLISSHFCLDYYWVKTKAI
jgi:hypothetical protein